MRSRVIFVALVLGVALLGSTTTRAQESPAPDPKDHRADIRTVLLKSTPPGSKADDVIAFIKKSLLKEGAQAPALESHPVETEAAVDAPRKGVKSLRYFLGSYLDNPAMIILAAPLVQQREVTIQWAFDQDDCLIDIFVDKRTATY